jgi:stage III sporulation protein AF
MGEIYEWVRNIVVFLILNTIIMNLLGNSSYKKYVSIVSGMILLLIVVSPFLKLFNMDGILDYYLNANIYQADVSDFQSELRIMEDKQKDAVFAGFNDRVKDQVADVLQDNELYLYGVDLVMNQDVESNSFGEIISMKIDAGYLEDEGIPVHSINIGKIIIANSDKDIINEEEAKQYLPSPEEIQIKNKLSDFYNMKQDNINISIQGNEKNQ